MASYVVTGHPLNYADTGLNDAQADTVRSAPTGATINLTLTAATDTKAKAHGVLR